jgi:hypothetical protein
MPAGPWGAEMAAIVQAGRAAGRNDLGRNMPRAAGRATGRAVAAGATAVTEMAVTEGDR